MVYDPETYMPEVADWRPAIENAAIKEAERRYPNKNQVSVRLAFIAGALWWGASLDGQAPVQYFREAPL